jgi:hypothetical protein
MERDEAIKKVPLSQEPGSELFNAWRMGEISQDDWYVFEATRALETYPSPYLPEALPAMPETLRSYCDKRVSGALPYDQELARRLGNWFVLVQRRYMSNEEKRGTVLWAIGKCEEKEITGIVAKGKKLLPAFDQVRIPDGLEIALYAKRMDAEARTKGGA